MPIRIILSFCVAALLALNSLSAATPPYPAAASITPAMPCDGTADQIHAHQTDCAMGCDSNPDDGRSTQPWASNAVRQTFISQQAPIGKAMPAYVSLLPLLRAPVAVSAARAPPLLHSLTPVDLQVVLLT
jgi:hypothetical protein